MALAVYDLPEPDPVAVLSDLLGLSRPAWPARAACRGLGPDDWFPGRGAPQAPAMRRARQVCAGCPVREQCVDFAGTDPYGIWGGLSDEQRKVRRRAQRAPAQAGPVAAVADPLADAPADSVADPAVSDRRCWAATGIGASTTVAMESVWQPDGVTLAEWRASPAGDHSPPRRAELADALAAIEAAFGRPGTAES